MINKYRVRWHVSNIPQSFGYGGVLSKADAEKELKDRRKERPKIYHWIAEEFQEDEPNTNEILASLGFIPLSHKNHIQH